jgi:hypothetical protein
MVLIIFSNRRVCCGIILVPAPIIMQSNFSRESVSETTLSAVSPKSTRQVCTSHPKSISLLIASCAAACTRLASHPVVLAKLESINLGSIPVRRTFFFVILDMSNNKACLFLSLMVILLLILDTIALFMSNISTQTEPWHYCSQTYLGALLSSFPIACPILSLKALRISGATIILLLRYHVATKHY